MNYKVAIFDLDGTILDTLLDLKISLNYALASKNMPERSLDEVRMFVGNGIRNLILCATPEKTTENTIDELYDIFSAHYKIHCADNTAPYDGIVCMLKEIRDSGVKTAVVSNKADFAVKELCERYFPDLFDSVVGERAGILRKPAPDSVNEVFRLLGARASEAVYIGDSDVDIETAKNAGCDMIAVDWGFRDRSVLTKHGAEIIVSSTEELKSKIV